MKKLTIAFLCMMTAAMTFAAQCEGVTQKGERCKRDAVEGSKFCAGHADKEKAKVEKQKDDGQCWAVTEAGTRCKHKKDGKSDYCKQHAITVVPQKPQARCRAMTWEGTQCPRKPEEGSLYCKQHKK
ncbi:MAG: hypothetical protein IJR99_10615 [Kiritimatiellae bacterium]|nr:hypothetical protein [Kiritimatiellia bacterium]